MKLKNTKLTLLSAGFIILFIFLGNWQLSRANEKKLLLKSFAERGLLSPLNAAQLTRDMDLRFYLAQLHGTFDNAHTLLLDNKIQDGKIGYEVYTPFKADGLPAPILIDRGFIGLGVSRQQLPAIAPIPGKVTLKGFLNSPPRYFSYGKMTDSSRDSWPLRIEYLDAKELARHLASPIFPLVLSLAPHDCGEYSDSLDARTRAQ